MSPLIAALLLLVASYLIGAIPFGYLVGRARGVNLFTAGSGNIGATNAARVLGTRYGLLIFTLDFLKGVVPVASILPLARQLAPDADTVFGQPDVLRVGAAALAFLGHLFPIYLGFRGGKGVATGAGTVFVLVPGPAALAMLFWVVVLLASRIVSLASLAAVSVLVAARLLSLSAPFSEQAMPITIFVLMGAALIIVKHHSNLRRLFMGTESRSLPDGMLRRTLLRSTHVVALGLWFGGAAFFNFAAAPAIFESFKQVVNAGPSDRTAHKTIIAAETEQKDKDALANALAGSAVGPVFPLYFGMQAICGTIALVTALSWYAAPCGGAIHRRRVYVIGVALLTVAVGWPISNQVSELRVLRFSADDAIALAAKAAFGPWHLVSLFLSFVTVCFAGIALALAGRLPEEVPPSSPELR